LTFPNKAKTYNGYSIGNNAAYRVFIMAVSSRGSSSNTLSASSAMLTLNNRGSGGSEYAPSNVTFTPEYWQDNTYLTVNYNRSNVPDQESTVSQYKGYLVDASDYATFERDYPNLNNKTAAGYANANASTMTFIAPSAKDYRGRDLVAGRSYYVYVSAEVVFYGGSTLSVLSPRSSRTLSYGAAGGIGATITYAGASDGTVTVDYNLSNNTAPGTEVAVILVPSWVTLSQAEAEKSTTYKFPDGTPNDGTVDLTNPLDYQFNALTDGQLYKAYLFTTAYYGSGPVYYLSSPQSFTFYSR
jgi:hypothetical protein